MTGPGNPSRGYDVFLSHGAPDKPWVTSFGDALGQHGLRCFLDVRELKPGDNWTIRLSDELLNSRSMALILSAETLGRGWVEAEWTGFLATHGATAGRLIPVLLDDVVLPPFLKPLQALDARHRDAARVAAEFAAQIGRLGDLPEGDVRRLFFGQDLVFVLEPSAEGDAVVIHDPAGHRREATPPWVGDSGYAVARMLFSRLTRERADTDAARAELHRHAATLGTGLFDLLFDDTCRALLDQAARPGQRPLVTIRADDDLVLSLPWELIHRDGRFLVRESDVDLARSDTADVAESTLLREPSRRFHLVVNVSAPKGLDGLGYEAESYRITRALADLCEFTPTELGSLADLVQTVADRDPTGLHFSGHGSPGRLAFEDDEGREDLVPVARLVDELRRAHPAGRLPAFFYLANCHGNDPAALAEGKPGVESLAARLHRAGVAQVVAYSGPILDDLSTEAEVALYAAIAAGQTTRHAVRLAREALGRPVDASRPVYRQEGTSSPAEFLRATHPFAWSQLVLYHRGPDHPLGPPPAAGVRRLQVDIPRRTFLDAGTRRILSTGFIGRRIELHRLRRKVREGQRVFVLQGLGGLGKSTLALRMVHDILHAGDDLLTFWCQDAEKADTPDGIATRLLDQLLAFCRARFEGWDGIVHQVDREVGDGPADRFVAYLRKLTADVPRLIVYLDNLESLLVEPAVADDPATFADWRSPSLSAIWKALCDHARDTGKLHFIASCRYTHDDFRGALVPVSPLPPDALFRLMGWFDGLRTLSIPSRARLAGKLAGHPRAVEFANDLIQHALDGWKDDHPDAWRLPHPPTEDDLGREWSDLIEPALPRVSDQLRADLLFDALWDRVLDDPARRMLDRMTLLRIPWEGDLIPTLGEPDAPPAAAAATARTLRRTSLLEQVDLPTRTGSIRLSTIHPSTALFVVQRSGDDPAFHAAAHLRIGTYYESRAESSPYIEDNLEAGHHLFQAGEYARSNRVLAVASAWLRDHGRVRESLQVLEPFLAGPVRVRIGPAASAGLLLAIGNSYNALGQASRAVGLYEEALAIAREVSDRASERGALIDLGNAYEALSQPRRAIEYFERALVASRDAGDRSDEGLVLGNLGVAYKNLGQAGRAIGYYQQALEVAREVGDHRGEGYTLGNLGTAYLALGQLDRAVGYYEQRLAVARASRDPRGERDALGNLGGTFIEMGYYEQAVTYLDQDLALSRKLGDRRGEGTALGNLGVAYRMLGQTSRAVGFLEQHLAIAREVGDRRGEFNALGNLGNAHVDLGQPDRALEAFEQSLRGAREVGDRRGEGRSLCNLGRIYATLGRPEQAITTLEQALQIAHEVNDPLVVQVASNGLAWLRGTR